MNPEQAKALDKWITTPPEEPEEKEKPAVDFYGDVIKDDACVVVIDCNVFKMVDGKARYGWKTYDVLATNMDGFIEEIAPSEYNFTKVMTGKEWREKE